MGIGCEYAGGICQQHQQSGPQQNRDLSGQEVVVAERDLVGRGRVVLVDDRNHPPGEQPRERLARIDVMRAGAHVEERQQHLRSRYVACAQQFVVDLVELALPNRARGLQLVHRPRAERQAHQPHPARDRSAGHDYDRTPRAMELGELIADLREHVMAYVAVLVGDDARAELDDQAGHGRRG